MILPRQDEDGNYYISYSQYNSFKDDKSFNLGIKGSHEYILQYFMGKDWPDQGWAQFGTEVEDYICERKWADRFKDEEKAVLNKIEPLGTFQQEIKLDLMPGVYLKGFIDDANAGFKKIRDYKTASKKSGEKYAKPEYTQLDIYSAWVKQVFGYLPDDVEVCIIERKGNCFGMVERRDLLSVGKEVWYVKREVTQERIDYVLEDIRRVVGQISDLYKVYLKTK